MTTLTGSSQLVVDLSNERVQTAADRLVKSLLTRMDIGTLIGVLTVALCQAFLLVLHSESPSPDTNIESLRRLTQDINEKIDAHEECARQHNASDDEKKKYEIH